MNNKEVLKKQIKNKELQIKKIHLHQNSSDVCSQLYNSLILEKAVLKKELELLCRNKIIEGAKNIFRKREKRICDYFKGTC